ncbi:MAG TPA: HD domain-containing protein [Pyrinomonadaceae bacterium]|jgi:(p)ppGpp synthase/HD superfamily hydrolase
MIWSQEAYLKAWNFAARAHAGQTLPGSTLPYLNHVGGVAMEVMTAVALEPVAQPDLAVQCALLHDVIEDTGVSYEQLQSEFGPAVAAGVLALTKDAALPKAVRMRDSLARIRRQPREVWLVKLADRVTNLQPPPAHWPADKIARYRAEALEIHAALADAHAVLAERLRDKIARYEAYLAR